MVRLEPFQVSRVLELKRELWHLGTLHQLALSQRPEMANDAQRYTQGCNASDLHTVFHDSEFSQLLPEAQFLQPILDVAQTDAQGQAICRARLIEIPPRTCRVYHEELAPICYHVPVASNQSCFLIMEDFVFRMRRVGCLYKIHTNLPHTMVNASAQEPMLHLILSVAEHSH